MEMDFSQRGQARLQSACVDLAGDEDVNELFDDADGKVGETHDTPMMGSSTDNDSNFGVINASESTVIASPRNDSSNIPVKEMDLDKLKTVPAVDLSQSNRGTVVNEFENELATNSKASDAIPSNNPSVNNGQQGDGSAPSQKPAPIVHHALFGALQGIVSGRDQQQISVQQESPTKVQRENRRKRRRKLHRLLKQPGVVPSFLSVISQSIVHADESTQDDDSSDILEPPVVVIDVDEYLGLKKKLESQPDGALSSAQLYRPPVTTSSAPLPHTGGPSYEVPKTVTPAEEGFYEGCVPMKMQEDATYLTDLQQLIRSNLEYFSATEEDIRMSQSGRRLPTVRGKVGIRCIHCARSVHAKIQQVREQTPQTLSKMLSSKSLWPAGSVSYPLTIAGMYSVCSQKPQLHFETCPNFPMPMKALLHEISQHSRSNQTRSDASLGGTAKRKLDGDTGTCETTRMLSDMSALMYYTIAAKRIGLVEITSNPALPGTVGGGNNKGLRFGRDLSLDPLPFLTVRSQVEREHPELLSKRQVSTTYGRSVLPDQTSSSTASATETVPTVVSELRQTIRADDDSERTLMDALNEPDDPDRFLSRRTDRDFVTDYMFLAIRQMLICHATKRDFMTRGKKTKSMRLGLAGFCCRHCGSPDNSDTPVHGVVTDYSCRSFSSAPDNLASAISNTFVLHLQNCPKVPVEVKRALTAYKRLHSRQMKTLVYGSQRRLFHDLWERLRAADLQAPSSGAENEDQDDPKNDNDEEWQGDGAENDDEKDFEATSSRLPPGSVPEVSIAANLLASSVAGKNNICATSGDIIGVDSNRENVRTPGFPVSNDPATKAILEKYESNWDPAENDHLITPADRHLVSDYVFLTMRQLKVAIPRDADFRGNRRNNVIARIAGMCCMHCNTQKETLCDESTQNTVEMAATPSGRSFPSAPDNMASALNSFFYTHMQNCYNVPIELKRAFANLRKIHSAQCASLMFGSQRKFFARVSQKLKTIPIGSHPAYNVNTKSDTTASSFAASRMVPSAAFSTASITTRVSSLDPGMLSRYCFVRGDNHAQCRRCRMVAFELRAPGSLLVDNMAMSPDQVENSVRKHNAECMEGGLHLEVAASALYGALTAAALSRSHTDENSLMGVAEKLKVSTEFPRLIGIVMGGNRDLTRLFSRDIFQEPALNDAFGGGTAKSADASGTMDVSIETSQTAASGESKSPVKGLWKDIPTSSVDFAEVEASFEALSQELDLASSNLLRDHPKMARFLEIISPYLNCPSLPEISGSPQPNAANPPVADKIQSHDEASTGAD